MEENNSYTFSIVYDLAKSSDDIFENSSLQTRTRFKNSQQIDEFCFSLVKTEMTPIQNKLYII